MEEVDFGTKSNFIVGKGSRKSDARTVIQTKPHWSPFRLRLGLARRVDDLIETHVQGWTDS